MSVKGVSQCTVTCREILIGSVAKKLDIIYFTSVKNVFQPINMIHNQNKDQLQQILIKFSQNVWGLGKLKAHQIKLNIDTSFKPVAEPQITLPYNL